MTSRKIIFVMLFIITVQCHLSWAYDGEVHYDLNEAAVNYSQLDSTLKNQLGITEGEKTEFTKDKETKQIWEWITYGGEAEDFSSDQWAIDIAGTRGYNHFHDPLENWDEAGLNAAINGLYWARYGKWPVSSTIWGLDPGRQDFPRNKTGDWSWGKAREYYYIYLTGKDFAGNTVAVTQVEREARFADCFRAVGQVMHLLEDASVPLHTRNDVHVFPSFGLGRWTYETYTKNNKNDLDYIPDQPGDIPSTDLLTDPQPDSSYTHLVPITGLFDRNQYNGDAIPSINAAIGLAEYSNANFLTEDTMWKYPHHSLNETNYDSSIWLNPEEVDAEDGEKDNRIYFRKDVGDPIDHVMAASYWYYQLYMWNSPELIYGFILTEKCYADYASKLIPRAVGYSAALLDYFFRGNMHVTSLPVFYDNSIYALMLYVKNITSSQEVMTNGTFSLVVRYTPTNGNADGSDDIFVRAYDVESGELQYNDGTDVQFYLSELIPIENYESVKCMLVFKGKLGNEENAVIGKSFSLGEIKFNEEWDNGLNGNYPWTHTTSDENPDNGSTSNVINNGILVKDNIRYIDYDTPRFNSSTLDFVDLNHSNGLLITPDTYLQFKIDDLSINEQPPAPEGSTTAWQYLRLRFNNELGLQFTQEGQGVYWGSNTAYYSFNLGWIIVVNIHSLFQNNGIAIPEPFYLQSMGLTQQFWDLNEPSTVEHQQHMEVDFMRIVERYVTPE